MVSAIDADRSVMRRGTVGTAMSFTSLSPQKEPSDAALLRQAAREAKRWQSNAVKAERFERGDRSNRKAQP